MVSKAQAVTTIKIREKTKGELDAFREHPAESYDQVIHKLIFVAKKVKKEPKLSQETINAIEESRERYKRGEYFTEEEARKRLGLKS